MPRDPCSRLSVRGRSARRPSHHRSRGTSVARSAPATASRRHGRPLIQTRSTCIPFHPSGKATGSSVEAFVEEARQWAIGPYATALLKGQKLQGEERAAIRRDLARFTGLSET
jgi:hypothetical protein